MGRACDFEYRFRVYIRFGKVTVTDAAYSIEGREWVGWDWRPDVPVNWVGSGHLGRLDPGVLGKVILGHAVPRLAFYGFSWIVPRELNSKALDVPNLGNLSRTSADVFMTSDGLEARFSFMHNPCMPHQSHDFSILLDSCLSPLLEGDPDGAIAELGPFLVAPWGDPELLGHCVLKVFEMAGPPVGKGMPGSVFESLPPKGRIGIHKAALSGDLGLLPARPRRVDPPDKEGTTPLMLASGAGHAPMVRRLLEMGADLLVEDGQGRAALHHAAGSGSVGVVGLLVGARADVSAGDMVGETALHVAASRGDVDVVRCLVAAGADLNASDALYGSTPLHRAARGDHAGVIEVLLDAGAAVDARNEAGRTPLHVAAGFAGAEALGVLLDAGADVKATDDRSETALHRPVFFQHMRIIEMLLAHGLDVAAADVEGNTALHVAGLMNRSQAAETLLAAGADPEALNMEGLTALDLAIVNYHVDTISYGPEHNAEVADVLLAHGATISAMRIPVSDRHPLWPHLTPRKLLRRGTGDINYYRLPDMPKVMRQRLPPRGDENYPAVCYTIGVPTLLHDAVAKNLRRVVEALLDSGASPMTALRDSRDGTPLHVAVRTGNVDMAKLLLDRGADVNMTIANTSEPQDDDHHMSLTPLLMAAQDNNLEMATLLLNHGANVNCHTARLDHSPWTPTEYAEPGTELHDLLRSKGGKTAEELNLK